MTAQGELAKAERKLRDQLRRVKLARQGLPADGSVVSSQADVARHFHVSRSTVHDWAQRGMPGEPGRYVISEIEAWRDNDASQEPDPLLAGADEGSDNLEEYRKWKAALARLEYEKASKQLVSREMVLECLNLAAVIIQRTADHLERLHGPAARETLMEAIDDFDQRITREFA